MAMFDNILNIILPDYPAHPVFESAGGIHLPGSLKAPGVIDNQEQEPVPGGGQADGHIQGDLLHYSGTVPRATPEKPAVIGVMGAVTQRLYEPFYRGAVTGADGRYHRP